MRLRWPRALAGAASAAALVAAGVLTSLPAETAAPDEPCGLTTLEATLVVTEDGTLACGPGRPVTVRTELATAKAARAQTRSALLSFLTLADLSIPDEESPLRTEFADACPSWPGRRSFRPHEALIPALVNAHVKAADALAKQRTGSPMIHSPYSFGVQLGSGADNQHANEATLARSLVGAGTSGPTLVDPDSGNDGYEGAQKTDPTGGTPALTSPVTGLSLRDLGNEPFLSPGIRGNAWTMPTFSVIGQTDVRAGGWMPTDERIQTVADAFATGRLKITALGSQRIAQICADPSVLASTAFWTGVAADPTVASIVTPDPARTLLDRASWMEEHDHSGLNRTHCTDATGKPLARACYSWHQDPIRFIALDTVPDTGTGAGDIDAAQLAWLERELIANSSRYLTATGAAKKTANKDRLVVIFSDHGSDTLTNAALGDDGAADGAQLEALLLRFPNVVLHIASHATTAGIRAHRDGSRGYWEMQATSASSWPSQSRSIEIADNHDGTLSIFGILFDAAAPPNARAMRWADDATDERTHRASRSINEDWLAAAAREIALHDPQRPQAPKAADANVELVVKHPWGVTASPFGKVGPLPGLGRPPVYTPTFPNFPTNFPTGFPGGVPNFPSNFGQGFPNRPQPQPRPEEMFTGTKALAVTPTGSESAYTTRIIMLFLAAAVGASWLLQARVRRWMVGI